MGERLEKLFTLTDIKNAFEAPVTIEAGGLIRDTVTGRVIARMYMKNESDKALDSVLVGFYPKDENGRPVSGMRDYRYEAAGIEKGAIFGDDVGILFDNDKTAKFSCEIQEVSYEDGDFWDKTTPEPIVVPEESDGTSSPNEPGLWSKDDAQPEVPDVWKDREGEEVVVPDLWKDGEPGHEPQPEAEAEPEEAPEAEVEPEPSQLEHQEVPQLIEETDATKEAAKKQVINLGGPEDGEGEVIELAGPTEEEEAAEPQVPAEPEEPAEPEVPAEPEEPAEKEESDLSTDYMQPVRLADMFSGFHSNIKGDIDKETIPEPLEEHVIVEPEAEPEVPEETPEKEAGPETPEPETPDEAETKDAEPSIPEPVIEEKKPEEAAGSEASEQEAAPVEQAETPVEKTPEPEKAEEAEDTSESPEEKQDPVMADPEKVFAAEPDAVQVPAIIDDKKQKALTGEDHSGRNLLNIVIFGAIAFVILQIILINM